jgi:hypothetical protein
MAVANVTEHAQRVGPLAGDSRDGRAADDEGIRKGGDTPLKVVGRGLLAGVVSTVALTVILTAGRNLLAGSAPPSSGPEPPDTAPGDEGISAGEALAEAPDMAPQMDRVTAVFAQKVATGLFGESLEREDQYVAGTAWHLAYGGFWGMSYALLESSLRVPEALLAPLHSLFVWAIGPGWLLPKMQLMLPPKKQEPRTLAIVLGVHEAYGALTALLLNGLKRRE